MTVQEASAGYFQLIEKILNHYAGSQFADEVKIAKSEFFDNAGILDERSNNFELRMSQFFDWYFFTRELTGYGQTPLEVAILARELRFSDQEILSLNQVRLHRHSIYEFQKAKDKDVFLKDIIKGDKILVRDCPFVFGWDQDEVFEARLIPFEDTFVFTKGFCFHPYEAKKFILSEIKRHKKDPDLDIEEMMLRLMKMRYKFERYKHVKIDMIYSNDSKVGL